MKLTDNKHLITFKTTIATLVTVLGLGCGATQAIAGTMISNVSQLLAQRQIPDDQAKNIVRIELSLNREENETYDILVERATATAWAVVQNNFDSNFEVTNVAVMIDAQNKGAIAPVLFLQVNRNQWASNPYAAEALVYFRSARSLLGFNDGVVTSTPNPQTVNPPNQTEAIDNNFEDEAEGALPVNDPAQSTNGSSQPGNVIYPTPGQTQFPNTTTTGTTLSSPQTPTPVLIPTSNTTINNPTPSIIKDNPLTSPGNLNNNTPGTLP